MREARIDMGDRTWRVDLEAGISIAIRLEFGGDQPNAFGLPRARADAVESEEFVGDTRRGGSVNCRTVTLNPHGNGTHTESIGHIVDRDVPIGSCLQQSLLPTRLVSVPLDTLGTTSEGYRGRCEADDEVITRAHLRSELPTSPSCSLPFSCLVVRTRPNESRKRSHQYSGHNPPYFSSEAIEWIRQQEVRHLLVDLPSIDRERDGGETPNHRAFWHPVSGDADAPRADCTITEMVFVPDDLEDGPYLMDLQMPDWAPDAAPSRPLLFEISTVRDEREDS